MFNGFAELSIAIMRLPVFYKHRDLLFYPAFSKHLLVIFLIQQMAAGLFRLMAGVFRTMIIAHTGGALSLLILFLLGGVILPKVYGLIVTQYGDMEDTIKVLGISPDPSIKWYVQNHFGYDLNFMGPTAVNLVAFATFFALMFAVCIKILNFQHR
ncbi:hypothetical protein QYF36_009466 [Acer negundo]|nr:hypothetical protein QYF36_009466 [Acer negundo]